MLSLLFFITYFNTIFLSFYLKFFLLFKDSISNHHKSPNTSSESCTRSGYITCPVCSTTRCYTTLQRRYGQFTCVACYRFFKEFFMKPTRYTCPYLGSCSLDVKTKCKACWILACIKVQIFCICYLKFLSSSFDFIIYPPLQRDLLINIFPLSLFLSFFLSFFLSYFHSLSLSL